MMALCLIAAVSCSSNNYVRKTDFSPGSETLQGKEVLFVYGGWEGHDPIGCRDLFVPWLESQGAHVTLSDSLGIYTNADYMAKVDLIIQCWTMGTIEGRQERALLNAVRRGVGFAGWHGGAGDSFRNNTDYQYMVGGQWVAHPDGITDYIVNITDKKDPVTKGLKDFPVHSEQYYVHVDPNVKVLATTTFQEGRHPWITGRTCPSVWKTHYGEGRVFYSSVGHVSEDFITSPEAFEIMKRGILWAIR